MFSSRGEDDKNFDRGGPGGNISNKLSMLPQRYTPDHSKRVWKVYHERQALLQVDRQCSRPVFVDPLVWGKLSAEKLTALIEKERKRSMRFVIGRAGKRCFLTGALVLGKVGWRDAAVMRKICFCHSPGRVLTTYTRVTL